MMVNGKVDIEEIRRVIREGSIPEVDVSDVDEYGRIFRVMAEEIFKSRGFEKYYDGHLDRYVKGDVNVWVAPFFCEMEILSPRKIPELDINDIEKFVIQYMDVEDVYNDDRGFWMIGGIHIDEHMGNNITGVVDFIMKYCVKDE